MILISILAPLACHPKAPAEAPVDAPAIRQPAPPPADDAIYFVLADRFANGDPGNDGKIDPADPQAFHGGDLQGVLDHLDHIQQLGARTVWLSPIYQMRDAKFYEWGAFHGYWVQDPGRVEPRFGDQALLTQLADELHRRDMRLLLDVVWNHVSFDAPLRQERPEWFHDHGGIEDWDDPFQLVNHEVHGLPDLAQENPEVRAWLLDTALHWLRAVGPDGFRVDAVRHMPSDFLAWMSDELRAAAGEGFLLLGEDFQGDPVALSETFEQGGFGAMFDFPLHYAMLDVFCDDRHPGRLGAMLSGDAMYARPERLVTFLDNHDLPRAISRCHDELPRLRRALAFQMSARGIPAITYGLEAGLQGAEEPENRGDMVFDAQHPLEEDIRQLLAFRRRHPALTQGRSADFALHDRLLSYTRCFGQEQALVVVNGGSAAVPLHDAAALQPGRQPMELLLADQALSFHDLSASDQALDGQLAPGALAVLVSQGDEGPSEREVGLIPLRIQVPDAPLQPGDQLLFTGSGRQLGNWNPAQPAGVFQAEGGLQALQLEVPTGAVLECKLVIRKADGSVQWQEGENRYALAPGMGGDPVAVELRWGE